MGHQTPKETKIWLQTAQLSLLDIHYYSTGKSIKKITANTNSDNWNTTTIQFERLKPNTLYEYKVSSEGKICFEGNFTTPQRTDTKKLPNYGFAFGSCTYINAKHT